MGATILSDIQYSYNGVNQTDRTDTDGTVTTFGYDNSNQLTSEVRDNSHSTGYSIAYTYDGNQNRLTKVLNSVTESYSYDSHDKLTAAGSKSYGYDNNGNCTSVTIGSNTTSLTWDDSNRCTGITYPNSSTNSFVYNGDDLRVSKTDSAGTSAVITDGTGPASPVLKDARAVYTPGISERASGTSKFYHSDALGSTRGITNGSQTVTDAVLYDGFGMTVSRTGSTATPFGFVGAAQYQSDADSGLQLLGHRMDDPSVGRFISSDPIQDGDNWFAYCDNDPLITTDPLGLMPPGTGVDGRDGIGRGPSYGPTPEPYDPPGWVKGIGRRLGVLGGRLKEHIQDFRDMLPAWPYGAMGPAGGQGGGNDGGEGQGGGQVRRGPPPHPNAGKTVREILKGKRGGIKQAELDDGSPSWEDIQDKTWEDIVKGAQQKKTGYRTFKKLLGKGEYDKK